MKYLLQDFFDELSDDANFFVRDGYVHLRSRYWSARDLLELLPQKDGKNEVLEELFSDWLEERHQLKIDDADEILRQFSQQDRFLKLSEEYASGAVIPFVGAGMSVPSGYQGWTNFLKQQWRQTTIPEAQLDGLLSNGKYEEAAQILADAMGMASFNEAVDSAFSSTRELSGCVEMLPYVFDGCVVTTNFDNVLERCYINAGVSFPDKIPGFESHEIRRRLAANSKFLLMLHGKATSGRGRILTKAEYDAHYEGEDTITNTIKVLCDSKSLLFLGCSLTADRTLNEIQEHVTEIGHDNLPKHYAFLASPLSEEERIERQRLLAECHIYPIWYPEKSHNESIEALLTKLWDTTR